MRAAFAFAVLVGALLASVVPAAASQSLPVTIHVYNYVEGNVILYSEFEASGPAVDAGLLCAEGSVTDLRSQTSGPPSWNRQNFLVIKQSECAESGSFTLRLSVHAIFYPEYSDVARWNVLGGTDSYAALHGTGSLVGAWDSETILHDVYTGSVHSD